MSLLSPLTQASRTLRLIRRAHSTVRPMPARSLSRLFIRASWTPPWHPRKLSSSGSRRAKRRTPNAEPGEPPLIPQTAHSISQNADPIPARRRAVPRSIAKFPLGAPEIPHSEGEIPHSGSPIPEFVSRIPRKQREGGDFERKNRRNPSTQACF